VHFLNKYWDNLDITIVGYEDVLKLGNMAPNVSTVSLGKQSDFGSMWTNGLIPFFKNIPEDYFTLILDDHILLNRVDEGKIRIIENEFINHNVDKAMIGGGIDMTQTTPYSSDLLLFNQEVDYRTSLHPAIWSKKYFLKYLKPDMTSWDFELKNNGEAKQDKAKIINFAYNYPEYPHLYSYLELYTKGTVTINSYGNVLTNQPSKRFFKRGDIKYIWDQIYQYNINEKMGL
tara:strand:+ start:2383 stop:3075 length:693 start_codon:yes stop_codon:yes gene_type:complete